MPAEIRATAGRLGGGRVAWAALARRYPAYPRPAKPISIIAQVEGSGIAFVAEVKVASSPTLVSTKAPPVVGKEAPSVTKLLPTIGPIEVVRSYVANDALIVSSISSEANTSSKPTAGRILIRKDVCWVGKGHRRTPAYA